MESQGFPIEATAMYQGRLMDTTLEQLALSQKREREDSRVPNLDGRESVGSWGEGQIFQEAIGMRSTSEVQVHMLWEYPLGHGYTSRRSRSPRGGLSSGLVNPLIQNILKCFPTLSNKLQGGLEDFRD